MPDENWSESYLHGMTRLSEVDRKQYTRGERVFVQGQLVCLSKGLRPRPRLDSLFRAASIQAVGIVEFIKAPIECCSPRLLNIGAARDPGVGRRNHPKSEWETLKVAVERLLATDDYVLLPSKRSLFRGTGLTAAGFWQHFPELSVNYEVERNRRKLKDRGSRFSNALTAAETIVASRLAAGRDVQIRRDGAVMMKKLGVTKAIAERAINAALVAHDILRTLKIGDGPVAV